MSDYQVQWSSATPGYIIFLVDQSASMGQDWTASKTQAEQTATVINRTIDEIINMNAAGEGIKDRVFISIIGYGGNNDVTNIRSDYLSEYAENPIRIDEVNQSVDDGNGGLVTIKKEQPIFIESIAKGVTPMGKALAFAKELIEGWTSRKPENPAPIIINISDGMPYNGNQMNPEEELENTFDVADKILNMSTSDGSPLIFNIHIAGDGQEISFPEKEVDLKGDEIAGVLYKISSPVPESFIQAASKYDFKVSKNSKAFIANGKSATLVKFINFGSMSQMTDQMKK